MKYYNHNGVEVRDSVEDDVKFLKDNLRKTDIDEIAASHNVTPEYALSEGLKNSSLCLTVTKGEPLAMFGICPESFISNKAVIWLLATENLMDVKLEFIRYSRKFIDLMLKQYPLLYNWVDARNELSVFWLKRIGADLKAAAPYGVDQLPFYYFEFTRA